VQWILNVTGSLVVIVISVYCVRVSLPGCVTVCVSLPGTITYCADVVMATKPGSVYDLAVLKIRNFHPQSHWPNRLTIGLPVEG